MNHSLKEEIDATQGSASAMARTLVGILSVAEIEVLFQTGKEVYLCVFLFFPFVSQDIWEEPIGEDYSFGVLTERKTERNRARNLSL